jgi:hypothetical protein
VRVLKVQGVCTISWKFEGGKLKFPITLIRILLYSKSLQV